MECSDRIAVLLAEEALRPVRLLRDDTPLAGVSIRALCRGHRYNITIGKTWPNGRRTAPSYSWSVREVEESGLARVGDGACVDSSEPFGDPEDAYWTAVEAINAVLEGEDRAVQSANG